MEAIANPPAYDRARAAVRYDDVARKLVLAFKYGDRTRSRTDDGAVDGARRARTAGRRRRADAGSAALAQAVGAALQPGGGAGRRDFRASAACRCCTTSLKRVRATPQQVGLSKTQRADNVQGAFRVPDSEKARSRRPPRRPGRRRADLRRHRRYLRPRRVAGRAPPMSTCWSLPGLSRRSRTPI